jgi:hypothetical protein
MRSNGFDEVMIVNPDERAGPARGVRLMPYYDANYPEMGGYADPLAPEAYGDYAAEDPLGDGGPEFAEGVEPYGVCGGDGEIGAWGDADYGAYAVADPNYYGAYEPVGYLAEDPYGAAYGYYGVPAGFGAYGAYGACRCCPRCGRAKAGDQAPETTGYAGDEALLGEEDPRFAYAAEPEFAAYNPDVPSRFNAGCPLPSNVAGVGEAPFDGFVRPAEVGPIVRQYTPAPQSGAPVPEAFRPLW